MQIRFDEARWSIDYTGAWLSLKIDSVKEAEAFIAAIREIGGNSATVCVADKAVEKLRAGWEGNGLGWITDTMESKLPGCTNVILYYGSSTYDTDQMSRLIELIAQECKQQGIETATPMELAALMEGWHEKHTARR